MNDPYEHADFGALPSDQVPRMGRHWYDVEPGVRAEVACYPDEVYINCVEPATEAAWLLAEEWLEDL